MNWNDIADQPGFAEAFLRSIGQGSLLSPDWMTSREMGDGALSGNTAYNYSQPVLDVLNKYQYSLESPQSGWRQYQAVDPTTGQVVYKGDPWKKSNWYDAPLEAAGVLGGMYLGASALNGGLLGLGSSGGAAAAGSTAGGAAAFDPISAYLTTGGVEGSIAGGAAAGGGAAGAIGGMGPLTGELLAGSTFPAATAPAGAGLFGNLASGAADFITKNPQLAGTLLGGLLGGGASGGGYNVGNRTPLKPLEQPKFTPRKEDYGTGLPGGLGSQSAGLFADYMRRMGG